MKFNKIIIALIAASCSLSSCHGDLDIIQDNKLSSSNMWKSESDATSATKGIYVYFRTSLKTVSDTYLCWGEMRNGLWGPGTNKTLSSVDQSQVRTSSMSSTNAYANWTDIYTTINQANLVIKYVPSMGLSTTATNYCLGNAYFMRAYCFFQVARIWGDAPLTLDGYESTTGDLYMSRTPKAEIYAQIEKDIIEAEKYAKDKSDKTVVTPDAVQMLKADFALWMYRVMNGGDSYLTMAETAINSLSLSTNKIEPEYKNIFSSEPKLGREVIFAVHQANGEATGGPAYYFGWNSNYIDAAYQNKPVAVTGGNQWWWYTDKYVDLLTADEADTRAKLTCIYADYGTSVKRIGYTEKSMGQMVGTARVFDSDFILYRYGEAYLLDAEIKYYKKSYSEALASLNVIAKRAYGSDNYYKDASAAAVKQAIVDENLKELVAEGRTWWMMIRMDVVWDYNSYVKAQREKNPNILLWPITQSSMSKNYNLEQTEGWF